MKPWKLSDPIRQLSAFFPGALALIYLLLITFPGYYQPFEAAQLDGGWQYALNFLSGSSYLFGRDAVFTYGPLGFLLVPLHVGNCLIWSAAFMVSAQAVFAAVLFSYFRASENKAQFLIFVLCFAVSFALGLIFEYQLLTIILLLCYLPSRLNRPVLPAGVAIGVLTGLLMLIKFNMGLCAILSATLAIICWWRDFGSKANRAIIATYLSCALTFGTLCAFQLRSLNNLWLWLHGSMEITRGYNDTMSLVDSGPGPTIAIFLLVAFFLCVAVLIWLRKQSGLLGLVAAASVFMAFKHGLIRQDAHEASFFIFLLVVLSMIGLSCRNSREAKSCYIAVAALFLLSLNSLLSHGVIAKEVAITLSTARGLNNVQDLLDMNALAKRLDKATALREAQVKLPQDLVERIKSSDNPTVTTLPNCVSLCPANGLTWHPLPVLLQYNAYTPYLDKLCADYFEAQNAPGHILYGTTPDLTYDFGEIDHRNPILESPLTALSLLRNYEPLDIRQNPDVLLLQRKASKLEITFTELGKKQYNLNEFIPVPESKSAVFGRFNVQLKPAAALMSKLYRLAPLMMECYSNDGIRTYRVAPDNLSSGMLVDCFPRNVAELAQLMNGTKPHQVRVIRFTGPGLKDYKRKLEISWTELSSASSRQPDGLWSAHKSGQEISCLPNHETPSH